jgi:hypothetical protein
MKFEDIYMDLPSPYLKVLQRKIQAKPTEGNLHQNTKKKKIRYEHRPPEAWFPCYGLLKIKEMRKVSTLLEHRTLHV